MVTYTFVTHPYVATIKKAATCTEPGETDYICPECNIGYTDTTKPAALGHSFSTIAAKTATCTEQGNVAYKKCTRCNLYFASDAATNSTDGKSDTSSFIIPAKGHTEVTLSAVSPTCTATGLTAGKKCSVCGAVTVAQQTVAKDPNNHSGSQTTLSAVAPTCTDTGFTEGKKWSCCNAIITAQQTVPAKGHNYASQVIAATAAVDGYTLHTCQNGCGSSYKDNYTINKIFFGTKQPSKIFFGTQEVKEVYYGTTKVYGSR